jgi:hypothetical protein
VSAHKQQLELKSIEAVRGLADQAFSRAAGLNFFICAPSCQSPCT